MACFEGCTPCATDIRNSLMSLLFIGEDAGSITDTKDVKPASIGVHFTQGPLPASSGALGFETKGNCNQRTANVAEIKLEDKMQGSGIDLYAVGLKPAVVKPTLVQSSLVDNNRETSKVDDVKIAISPFSFQQGLPFDDTGLRKQNTTLLVDDLMEKRNKRILFAIVQTSFLFIALVLDIIGAVSKGDEVCDGKLSPGWRNHFIIHAVMVVTVMSLQLLICFALTLKENRDVLTAKVHHLKGKEEEALKDLERGMELQEKGKALMKYLGCFLCILWTFGLAWLITGICLYVESANEEACNSAKHWFIAIITANMLAPLLSSVLLAKPSASQRF